MRTAQGFRLLTEPASLKHAGGGRADRPLPREFPAPHRAGLIEADTAARRCCSRVGSSFRLLTEPASLKRGSRVRAPTVDPGFRLLTEPASLKRHRGVPRVRPYVRFRLLTEPASLKPGLDDAEPARVVRFPAPHRAGLIEAGSRARAPSRTADSFRLLTEPASLKRGAGGAGVASSARFPAPHRAGLIEASEPPPGRTPGRLHVSGSSQSRPH